MHGPKNVKSSNNTSKWLMGFNSAFKGLKSLAENDVHYAELWHNVIHLSLCLYV
jgi:hypothetical protein